MMNYIQKKLSPYIVDLVVIINLFGIHTYLVIIMTHVMVLEIPVHPLQWLIVPTLKMSLLHVVSDYNNTVTK